MGERRGTIFDAVIEAAQIDNFQDRRDSNDPSRPKRKMPVSLNLLEV